MLIEKYIAAVKAQKAPVGSDKIAVELWLLVKYFRRRLIKSNVAIPVYSSIK